MRLPDGTALGRLTPRQGLFVMGLTPSHRLGWTEGPQVTRRSRVPGRLHCRCTANATAFLQRRRAIVGEPEHVAEIAQSAEERESDEHRCEYPDGSHFPSLQAPRRTIGDG
jgi:hypothetical protein